METIYQAALLLGSLLPSSELNVVFTCSAQNTNQQMDLTEECYPQDHLEGNLSFGWQPQSFTTSDTTIGAGHTEYKLLPVNTPLKPDATLAIKR
ncbi:hypothetical protein V5799_025218 [Amblyomma americanum]|uniref:Uncharacterized protein n=1 Tax=Amblyomma americanum TaxID=6943 RepID=A0AAQ4E9U9_AMBAM